MATNFGPRFSTLANDTQINAHGIGKEKAKDGILFPIFTQNHPFLKIKSNHIVFFSTFAFSNSERYDTRNKG